MRVTEPESGTVETSDVNSEFLWRNVDKGNATVMVPGAVAVTVKLHEVENAWIMQASNKVTPACVTATDAVIEKLHALDMLGVTSAF